MPLLLRQPHFLTFFLLLLISTGSATVVGQEHYRLVFWNVENFFDTQDDTLTLDDEFTPQGSHHWTSRRYRTKCIRLCQTLTALGDTCEGSLTPPLLIGMAEVENDKVLRDLCKGTPLRRYGYKAVHYDSPDRRGIDCALLYQSSRFAPYYTAPIRISDSSENYFTRDILHVEGTTPEKDTLIVLVNHFPSRRGGDEADRLREALTSKLRCLMDSLSLEHPAAAIVVMGDFNAAPTESEIKDVLMQSPRFINLMTLVEPGRGSYKYQDFWSCIDQIIVSRNLQDGSCQLQLTEKQRLIFDAPFLLIDDERNLGKKVFRTYLGPRYQGGFSDHLPVFIDLTTKK